MAFGYGYYPEYVSVADKIKKFAKMGAKLAKTHKNLWPVTLTGNKIGTTFWGKAWCDNIKSYEDYSYRIDRGRTYIRHGAVLDLQITEGLITAWVGGSYGDPYQIKILIQPLSTKRWEELKPKCTGKISSLLALAQGKLPKEILGEFCNKETGLFPAPSEIKMSCTCPDSAGLCKHIAAVLFAVGVRLDQDPKLFFVLRCVDENELIGALVIDTLTEGTAPELATDTLGDVFGIELDTIDDIALPAVAKPRKVTPAKPVKVTPPKPVKVPDEQPKAKLVASKVLDLRSQIRHHDALYYDGAEPEITDMQYDRLARELRKQEMQLRKIDVQHAVLCEPSPLPHLPTKQPPKPIQTPPKILVRTSGDIVLAIRKELGLTQAALAKLCGTSAASISQWENRVTLPPSQKMKNILALKKQLLTPPTTPAPKAKPVPAPKPKATIAPKPIQFKHLGIVLAEEVVVEKKKPTKFGRRPTAVAILDMRFTLEMSQATLAKMCLTSQGAVDAWERNMAQIPEHCLPTLYDLIAKAKGLKVAAKIEKPKATNSAPEPTTDPRPQGHEFKRVGNLIVHESLWEKKPPIELSGRPDGRVIHKIRFRLALSQAALAKMCQTTQASVSAWERGAAQIPEHCLPIIQRLIKKVNVLKDTAKTEKPKR